MTSEFLAESTVDEPSILVDNDSQESQSQMDIALAPTLRQINYPADSTVDEPPEASSPERSSGVLSPKYTFEEHEDHVRDCVFLHDNIHIVSGSEDGTMRKWDCETGLLVGEPWKLSKENDRSIYALALSPDGKAIACGRVDGGVERWNTYGEMIEGIWTGHSDWVRSLSWSPTGDHLASGSDDGTILIRNVESGEIEVGPIEASQGWVRSVAYSPLGDRIASGGENKTICIWDNSTGELLVGPIDDLGDSVTSVVWSFDGTKLYSASDAFVRVFDSTSGTELHRFEHDRYLNSIALSPKHQILVCVGNCIAQLWDTESCQPLGRPFHQEDCNIYFVLFSRDGRYVTCRGNNNSFTVWNVKDIAPEIKTPSPSCLEVDATRPFAQTGDESDAIYNDFFRSSEPSHPLQSLHNSSAPRWWNAIIPSRYRRTASESIQLHGRPKRHLLSQHTGPQPVTVFATRRKQLYVRAGSDVPKANGHTNAQATSSSTAANQSSATQPQPASQMPHQTQSQPAAQHVREEYDYGCWGNFLLTVCCIHPRPRQIVPVVQLPAS